MRSRLIRKEERRAFLIVLAMLAAAGAGQAEPRPHPSLVDPAKTHCETCHAAKVSEKYVHAATESCDNCHEFSKVDGKTVVQLADEPPALCVMCHDDLKKASEGDLAAPHAPVLDTCLNCHSPHSSPNEHLLLQPVPEVCLKCHAAADLDASHTVSVARSDCRMCHLPHGGDSPKLLIKGTQHPPFAERSCQACHRRGMSARAKANSSRICFACHDPKAFTGKFVHTAVANGQCVGCHSPHLSPYPKLTLAEGPALCVGCHDDIGKRLSEKSVHPPAKDSCLTCHGPHTGDNPKQLVDKVPDLCLMCHDASDADLKAKHQNADLSKLVCTSCHNPHGSTQPSLLADRSVHPPFADRNCEICHQGSATKLLEDGSSKLCLACHSEIEKLVSESPVPHPALDVIDCKDCHTPHASPNRKLEKAPAGKICFDCHDDKQAGSGEIQHGAITAIGCEVCHEPHGGKNAHLLRTDVNDLCLGCHQKSRWSTANDGEVTLLGRFKLSAAEASKIREVIVNDKGYGHPVVGHRTLGEPSAEELKKTKANFNGTLSCITCHDPHKGRVEALFAGGATEICTRCHNK